MKLNQARIIAFDNDGTLYPSGEEIGKIVLTAHRDYVKQKGLCMDTPDLAWVKAMIGQDATHFYPAMMPGQPPEVVKDFEDFCLTYETDAVKRYPDMFEGMDDVLGKLKDAGRTILLVTNGGPRYVNSVWEAAGYGRFISGSYPFAPPEYLTKGERLKLAVEEWGGGPAVMVGDRASDKEAAEYAGTMFIGCSYGYAEDWELQGADALVDNPAQLLDLLL